MSVSELQTLKRNSIYYSDITANFEKSLISNDLSASFDLKAVQESLVAIVKTNKGDRPFYPEFGSDVSSLLFENMSNVVSYSIKKEIESCISLFEPRVIVKNVVAVPDYDRNTYHVTIEYHLITDYDTLYQTKFDLRRSENA